MKALQVIGIVLLSTGFYGGVGALLGMFAYKNVMRYGKSGGYSARGDALAMMNLSVLFWPVVWIFVMAYWLVHRNGDDTGNELPRKLRRKIEAEERLLELERARNNEIERHHRIIAEFTKETSYGS